jgi:hypothetical protein
MLDKIISDGQRAADQAAWRAAKTFGVPTGGSPGRTELSVQDSQATLWFGLSTTAAAQETVEACHRLGKPCMPVYPGASFEPRLVATWIAENEFATLNVAGNRENDEPGIGARLERFLGEVLERLGHKLA